MEHYVIRTGTFQDFVQFYLACSDNLEGGSITQHQVTNNWRQQGTIIAKFVAQKINKDLALAQLSRLENQIDFYNSLFGFVGFRPLDQMRTGLDWLSKFGHLRSINLAQECSLMESYLTSIKGFVPANTAATRPVPVLAIYYKPNFFYPTCLLTVTGIQPSMDTVKIHNVHYVWDELTNRQFWMHLKTRSVHLNEKETVILNGQMA
jgi:hypothetical protein